jgi:hypothetical protein
MGGYASNISGQWLGKHVPTARHKHNNGTTIEELFSVWSMPRCYKQETRLELGHFCTGVCEDRA